MRVLDLFCGLKGWSQAFQDRGHEVITVDIEQKFNPTICKDIIDLTVMDFKEHGQFAIVLASPPCNCFSIASVYRHWDKNTKRPKDSETFKSISLVANTIHLILDLYPRWWILENPRGMLRSVLGKPAVTTYWASWQTEDERYSTIKGFHDKRKPCLKPTDLWGVLPDIKWEKPLEWQKASRGSRHGTQAIIKNPFHNKFRDSSLRAKIPYGLSLAVCLACEKELEKVTEAEDGKAKAND